MKLDFEYGQGTMSANLPDNTDIFIPGKTIPDPAYIPEDKLVEMTRKSIQNPIGMEPFSKLAHKGSKVTIIFPDRVKGGEQPTAHRKVSIPIMELSILVQCINAEKCVR
jgi:nickel-dependent lactate racemase